MERGVTSIIYPRINDKDRKNPFCLECRKDIYGYYVNFCPNCGRKVEGKITASQWDYIKRLEREEDE